MSHRSLKTFLRDFCSNKIGLKYLAGKKFKVDSDKTMENSFMKKKYKNKPRLVTLDDSTNN